MAGELGLPPSAAPEAAAFAVPSSALLRGLLEWVANHSGVDEAVIRGFLRDVSAYLELPGCRAAVQAVVRPALLADPGCVLVGHSLGGWSAPSSWPKTRSATGPACSLPSGRLWAWMR